ncbi:MAG: beta-mannosidase [Tenacibaculum sp.]
MRNISFILFSLIILSCSTKNNLPVKQELTENWYFKGKDTLNWQEASVPGNIFVDLMDAQIIPNPFVLSNEKKVKWVSNKHWEYKSNFKLSKKLLDKKNINLCFYGLDTYANVYLNKQLIVKANNAFKYYKIPVNKLLKNNNELLIKFEPVQKRENMLKKQLPYSLPEGNRVFSRKPQFQYGWDWGPELNTCGIWKKVTIKAWDTMIFDNIFIKQKVVNNNFADLIANININSSVDTTAKISCLVDNYKTEIAVDIKKGSYSYKVPLRIKNPKLWWVHNLGTPYLYQFNFTLRVKNTIYDKSSIKKGIRTLKLITQKDSIGESFYFQLNGKPIYIKGANYIPQNSFQNWVKKQHYRKLLSDVVNSNMNMLRVWGGGIYESDYFYNLCDEKGILIWQDFMFACAMYPGDKEFLKNVKTEAIQQVKRLRNYSSIALWCGNNENSEGWHNWGWQKNRTESEKKQIWSDYQKIFNGILPEAVAKYSDATNYWESSPKYGRGNDKFQFEGDAHDWSVWHDGAAFNQFEKKVPRFMSEFGFQSFPSYQLIKYINQSNRVDISTKALKDHQKNSRGFQLIRQYMQDYYPIPEDDEDYIYISQLLQAKSVLTGIKAHRRAKPKNMGTLYWQLNDCWPAISWSSIDYFGNWKALQYKAKKAFKNLFISSEIKNDSLKIYLINDHFKDIEGKLELNTLNFDGKTIDKKAKNIYVNANSSNVYANLSIKNIDKYTNLIQAKFNGESVLIFLTKPKELQLKKTEIKTNISKVKKGFAIQIQSKTLLKDVFLFTDKKGHFSDNFFDVLPNKIKTLVFETKADSLPSLKVKALNNLL